LDKYPDSTYKARELKEHFMQGNSIFVNLKKLANNGDIGWKLIRLKKGHQRRILIYFSKNRGKKQNE
jgi:hypothetical protein|tara:strand:+ start:37678 stop:37878 length:201 start_codon:yes stop_codon:yes gene_type:complete